MHDLFYVNLQNLVELENWMFCFSRNQLKIFFRLLISESLSETLTFSASSTNSLLNFAKLEHHILVWKAFYMLMI